MREAALRQDRRALTRLIAELLPRMADIRLDGDHLPDDYLLIEAMNAPMLGLRFRLAPRADPATALDGPVLIRAELASDTVPVLIPRRV